MWDRRGRSGAVGSGAALPHAAEFGKKTMQHRSMGFDVQGHYDRIARLCAEHGWEQEKPWDEGRAASVEGALVHVEKASAWPALRCELRLLYLL